MVLRRWFMALAVAAALTPQDARADTVTLKNGREIHGRLIEERADSVRMRTEGGTITIEKAEIASFTEGEVFTNYGGRTRTQDEVNQATPPTTTPGTPGTPGTTPPTTTPGGATPAAPTGEWKWPANLSAETIAELTPIRDQVLADLEKLGPTPEERLKAVIVSGEERTRLNELMLRFNYRQRQGSANAQRNQARDHVLEFGLKAIPFLADGLTHEAQWTRRISAQGCERLAKSPPTAAPTPPQNQGTPPARPGQPAPTPAAAPVTAADVRWLMYHFQVPERLVVLLDHQGEIDSPFIRAEGAAALAAVTGLAFTWPTTAPEERLRTSDENKAKTAVEAAWVREKARFTREQEANAKSREALLAKVALLREGRNPNAAPATPPR